MKIHLKRTLRFHCLCEWLFTVRVLLRRVYEIVQVLLCSRTKGPFTKLTFLLYKKLYRFRLFPRKETWRRDSAIALLSRGEGDIPPFISRDCPAKHIIKNLQTAFATFRTTSTYRKYFWETHLRTNLAPDTSHRALSRYNKDFTNLYFARTLWNNKKKKSISDMPFVYLI